MRSRRSSGDGFFCLWFRGFASSLAGAHSGLVVQAARNEGWRVSVSLTSRETLVRWQVRGAGRPRPRSRVVEPSCSHFHTVSCHTPGLSAVVLCRGLWHSCVGGNGGLCPAGRVPRRPARSARCPDFARSQCESAAVCRDTAQSYGAFQGRGCRKQGQGATCRVECVPTGARPLTLAGLRPHPRSWAAPSPGGKLSGLRGHRADLPLQAWGSVQGLRGAQGVRPAGAALLLSVQDTRQGRPGRPCDDASVLVGPEATRGPAWRCRVSRLQLLQPPSGPLTPWDVRVVREPRVFARRLLPATGAFYCYR